MRIIQTMSGIFFIIGLLDQDAQSQWLMVPLSRMIGLAYLLYGPCLVCRVLRCQEPGITFT